MRSVLLFALIFMVCPFSRAQELIFASELFEYSPAPGQFINDPISGSPSASLKILNGIGNPVSLGAYGGFIVLGFNSPVKNSPDNPYGIDFIIYGNASSTHAEPGIVKVMKDENLNGLPDDTWYEIAGSAHFTDDLKKDYRIEYTNPNQPFASDVTWTDNLGVSGKVFKNSFHYQPYYPQKDLFPNLSDENLSFEGNVLKGNVAIENKVYESHPYAFGYADMRPFIGQSISGIPDNPYTKGIIEGNGGDGIDITWATDAMGEYVYLDEINFIMIYTGVNDAAGWLGEISTEIRGIVDVNPNKDITGQSKMILAEEIPKRITNYDGISLKSAVFFNGRQVKNEKIRWEGENPLILTIKADSLFAVGVGKTVLKGTLVSDESVVVSKEMTVINPDRMILSSVNSIIQKDETIEIRYSLVDKDDEELESLIPEVNNSNSDHAEVLAIDKGKITILGKSAGKSMISLFYPAFPGLTGEITIDVTEKLNPIRVRFSLSNQNKTIIPGQTFIVEKADILSVTNRFQEGFNPDKSFITLADAIACILKNQGFGENGKSLAFRQDEFGGSGLYVWQIGYDWIYEYGWGGLQKDDTYAKTWFAIVNTRVFASGFDTIEIFDGDRISIQYIQDNRQLWRHTRIIPEKDEISINETIRFLTEQLDIYPSQSNGFSVSGPFPKVNGEVNVDQSVLNSESDHFTSSSGEFNLNFQKGGLHEVAVDQSETVVINVKFPLSDKSAENNISFYPNPCTDELHISNSAYESVKIRIFSMDGSLKMQDEILGESSINTIKIGDLAQGMYVIEMTCDRWSIRQKLCKQ